jgi:hypothetical protein
MAWDLSWLTTEDTYYSVLAAWTTAGNLGWGRVTGFFPRLLGVRPGAIPLMFGLTLFLLPLAAGARLNRRLIACVPLALCTIVLFLVPGILFGTDFTFQRFTVFALPLYVVLLQKPNDRPWARWTWPAVALIVAAWIGVVSANARAYERDAAGFTDMLSRMEPGERVLFFAFERDSDGTIAPTFLHFPAWYGALKHGVVDPSVAGTHVQLVLYRPERLPGAMLFVFEWLPRTFNWTKHNGAQYRYFVARASVDRSTMMFRTAPCKPRLIHHSHRWWLYENTCP